LLAPIGSGTVSNTDTTALTSFDLTYGLALAVMACGGFSMWRRR